MKAAAAAPFFRALARCWLVVLVYAGLMYFFTAIEQGREGLRAAADETPAVLILVMSMIALMATAALARLRVSHLPTDTPGELFAFAAVPPLVTVAAAFSLALAVGAAGSQPLQGDRGVGILGGMFIVVGGFAIAAERLMQEISESRAHWRDRLARTQVALCTIGAASLGALLGWPAWAVFLLAWAGVLVGAVLAVRSERSGIAAVRIPLAHTVGFGGVYAFLGLVAAWNHAADPVVAIGTVSGPFLALMLVLAGWLGLAFAIELLMVATRAVPLSWLRRSLQWGLAALGVVLAGLFLTGPYNEASVTTLAADGGAPGVPVPSRRSLEQHAQAWIEHRRADIEAAPGAYPVIVVAAEGGGMRAAYWAATVLTGLHDRVPGFSDHVFAVSGVSGGSVGASVYAALVHHQRAGGAPCGQGPGMLGCAASVLSADLLSAPLVGALVGDVLRSTLRSTHWPDRARVLDGVLAAGWQKAVGTPLFSQGFVELWSDQALAPLVPLLTPNATSAVTGRRVVLLPMPAASAPGADADWLFDAVQSLPLASATLVSARFPLVSPTALLAAGPDRPPLRLVDGGYADNSGAATASDMMRTLLNAARHAGLQDKLRPVALVLRNSPDPSTEAAAGGLRSQLAGTLLEPAATLDSVRAQLALRYVGELETFILARQGVVLDGLRLQSGAEPFALGWMLSQRTRQEIDTRRLPLQQTVEPVLCQLLGVPDCPRARQ
jgi:hypothetical protein